MRLGWQELENIYLGKYGCKSQESLGRQNPEEECAVRTCFQRDRDRIIHSKSFRRLKHKTQVFIAVKGDHYRTRLTHTLEVSQISRTISRALHLNEDLTEAIALGHDLGHMPFGHAGERSLQKLVPHFTHNCQSLRVVEVLEREGQGLNLTAEVRDGILCHSGDDRYPCTLEGAVVRLSDRIAYINHDIDDSLRAGIFQESQLPSSAIKVLGGRHSQRINTMVMDVITNCFDKDEIKMSPEIGEATNELREYMFKTVYLRQDAQDEECKVARMIQDLYHYYLHHPGELPDKSLAKYGQTGIVDYIAGMTDQYALNEYKKLFTL